MFSAAIEFKLLGAPAVRLAGSDITPSVRKGLALVAYLALEGETSRERLADLLWTDMNESDARRNLRQELWRLQRSALGAWLEAKSDRVTLTSDVRSDVADFQRSISDASLGAALQLYSGPLLANLELSGAPAFEDWLEARREGLNGLWRLALGRYGAQLEARGDLRGALESHVALLREDEFQEVHQREAMRLQLLLGERGAVVERFERYARLLQDELGLRPLPETEALALRAASETDVSVGEEPVGATSVATPTRLTLPLVGRGAEWTQLERSHAALTVILGEPGIGKTRLADAFGATFGVALHLRAFEASLNTPLYPAAEALRAALGDPRGVERLTALEPVWRTEAARLVPELEGRGGHASAMTTDGRARFLSGVAHALSCAAGREGILIFDDLHWADQMTLELLLHLARQSSDLRPRLIATVRTLELAESAGLSAALIALEREGRLERVALSGLTEAAVLSLIQRLSGGSGAARFAARLFQVSAGNPLFMLESIQHLFETGALRQSANGSWNTPFDASTSDYTELPLPESVREAIVRRTNHHGPAARRLLEAASLSDDRFDLEDLAPALSLSDWEAVEAFERLLEAGLILRRSEQGFAFSHDLVRRVTLEGLSPERRRLIHRRLAERLEKTGGGASQIARHLEQGGQREAAIVWRVRAAARASRVYAHVEALRELDLALTNGADATTAYEIHTQREALLRALGDSDGRSAAIEALARLAQSLNDPALELRTGLTRLALLNDWGHFAPAFQLAETLHSHPALAPASLGLVLSGGAEALLRLDRVAEAAAWYGRVIALGDAVPLSLLADAHAGQRVCAVIRGDFAQAQLHNAASLEGYRAAGDIAGEASALNGIGRVAVMLGEYETAEGTLELALSTAQRIGHRYGSLLTLTSFVWLESQRGRYRRALELYQTATGLNASIRNGGFATVLEVYRSHALQQAGDLGACLTVIAGAVTAAEHSGSRQNLVVARRRQALSYLALGDTTGATVRLRDALRELANGELRSYQPSLEIALAHCALRRDDPEAAQDHLHRAEALAHLAYAHERRDLELTLAETQLRLGTPQRTLNLDTQADTMLELRARALKLRLAGLLAVKDDAVHDAIRAAQEWLLESDVPALEGLELRWMIVRALVVDGRVKEAAATRALAEVTLRDLAATLGAHPELQTLLLEKYAALG